MAAGLLHELGIDAPPVDPFGIAQALGIVVRGSESLGESFSGCLVRAGGSFGILYSKRVANAGFQRFTVAHEIGRFALQHPHEILFRGSKTHRSESGFVSRNWYEREADWFGAELLIPEHLFRATGLNGRTGLEAIKAAAREFETSLTATALRYVELASEPVATVLSEGERVVFACVSGEMARVLHSPTRGVPKVVPDGSKTRGVNEDGAGRREERGVVAAATWFGSATRELELVEEVVGLGRYGKTLTVLTVTKTRA